MSDTPDDDVTTLRRAARDGRRAFARSQDGQIATQLKDAWREYERMRREGVSRDDACRGLELILRDVFPATPYGPDCTICDDTGWRIKTCSDRLRCARRRCAHADPEWEHTYAVLCDCPKGDAKRQRVLAAEDALAAVGRAQQRKPPARGFRRMGE